MVAACTPARHPLRHSRWGTAHYSWVFAGRAALARRIDIIL